MSSMIQRLRWRLSMSFCRSAGSVERLAMFACLFCCIIVFTSWYYYERSVDTRTSVEQRRHKQKQLNDDYINEYLRLQKEEEEYHKSLKNSGEQRLVDNEVKLQQHRRTGYLFPPVKDSKEEDDDREDDTDLVKHSFNFDLEQVVQTASHKNKPLQRSSQSPRIVLGEDLESATQRWRQKSRSRSERRNLTDAEHLLGELSGGEAKVKLYSTSAEVKDDDIQCMTLKVTPPTHICLHQSDVDVHVSRHLRDHGVWEPYTLGLFQKVLNQNHGAGVYDIGSHIGEFGLVAAVMGHKVVAVEPLSSNLIRLHMGIRLNNVTEQVLVVQNAISDQRETFELSVPEDNRGGTSLTDYDADKYCTEPDCPPHAETIYMDDLLEVTNFKTAVIKIDIEGHEHRAFVRSAMLFKRVRILYIFMEWIKLRGYYGAEVDDSEDKRLVFRLVDMLIGRGYIAHGVLRMDQLDPKYWYAWPDDIVWRHQDVVYVD